MELSAISIIKPRQIKILQEEGINTVEALAMNAPRDLAEFNGISDKMSKQLIWSARDILNMSSFKQVSSIEENYEYLSTGSESFDEILGGGISTGRLTEVYGAFKSGKTNLAHTLCVTCQMPKDQGGLDGAVLFIDTENTFSKTKIKRIARRFGMDEQKVLQNIFHARIFSTDHQLQMVRAAEQAIKDKHARLIIIDSLLAIMRSEYIGIGMLAARQQVLNKLIHDLSRLAETYNIAVYLTNQVSTVMKGTFSANDAIGGNIVAHGCHFRIQFKTSGFQANSSLERTATIVDAPDLPPESTKFFITEAGISDTENIEYPKSQSNTKSKTKKNSIKDSVVLKDSNENEEENLQDLQDPLEAVEKALAKEVKSTKQSTKKKSTVSKKASPKKKSTTKKSVVVKRKIATKS
ncbi:MAG: DNA repair and recombination protein RadA [Promethearchaeota archaeon]